MSGDVADPAVGLGPLDCLGARVLRSYEIDGGVEVDILVADVDKIDHIAVVGVLVVGEADGHGGAVVGLTQHLIAIPFGLQI